MARFKNVQVFGPEALSVSDVEAQQQLDVEVKAVEDSDDSDEQASPEPDIPGSAASAPVAPVGLGSFVKDNRRLAIFGAFAVGVFLGSMSRR